MKLQNLSILFIILIIPIALVMGLYIRGQGDTIILQNQYNKALDGSTYDAVSAYKINTMNNELVDNADSIREDIKAATNVFMTSMASNLNMSKDAVKAYVPAMLYTLYDGYYIYSAVKDDAGKIDYTLKPYIYYSETIKDPTRGANLVINYTLDNYIAIYGTVKVGGDTKYIAKSGYLIDINKYEEDADKLYYKVKDTEGNEKRYEITKETLSENLLIRIPDGKKVDREEQDYRYETHELQYKYVEQKKVYYLTTPIEYKKYDVIEGEVTSQYEPGWYTYSSTRGELVESEYDGDGATGYSLDDSAIEYYQDAYEFTNKLLVDYQIADIAGLEFLDLGEDNDPEDHHSDFSQHKREVIKQSIVSNLKNAISTFNAMSQALHSTYNYKMPILLEEDWEKIYTEVGMTTFFQGIPIGFKAYNNYSIISMTGNKQFVNPELLYFIDTTSDEHHKITCNNLDTTTGYRSIDFEQYKVQKTMTDSLAEEDFSNKTEFYYYYKHLQTGDYSCIIQDQTEKGIYENGYFSDKLINSDNATAYFTTLARERYNQYKATGYLNKEFNIAEEEPMPEVTENDFSYQINLCSYKDGDSSGVIADYEVKELIEGSTQNFTDSYMYEIGNEIIYASTLADEEEKSVEFKYEIKQTNVDDAYYPIDDDTIEVDIVFKVKKEDGKIKLTGNIDQSCDIPNNPDLLNRYGNIVVNITSEVDADRQGVIININIYNTPKTYIASLSEIDLNVILNGTTNIDLEPYIEGIRGVITVIYFTGNDIREFPIQYGEVNGTYDDEDPDKTYQGTDWYKDHGESDPAYVSGHVGNEWFDKEWQIAIADYTGTNIIATGVTGLYKVNGAGGVIALSEGTNDDAITKIGPNNTESEITTGGYKMSDGRNGLITSWSNANTPREFTLIADAHVNGTIDPIANFAGEFEGNNNVISGVEIVNRRSSRDNQGIGLFASNSGKIENLEVEDLTVYYDKQNEFNNYIGGVIGQNKDTGIIYNITIRNSSITGNTYVGGIVGCNGSKDITNLKAENTDVIALGDRFEADSSGADGLIEFYQIVNNREPTHIICVGGIVGISQGDIVNAEVAATGEKSKVHLDIGNRNYQMTFDADGELRLIDGVYYTNYIANYLGGIVGYTTGDIIASEENENKVENIDIRAKMDITMSTTITGSGAVITSANVQYGHQVYMGGIAGSCTNTSRSTKVENTKVNNVTIDGTKVSVTAPPDKDILVRVAKIVQTTNVGGIVGCVESDVSISNVNVDNSDIKSTTNVGGVAGSNFTNLTSDSVSIGPGTTVSGNRNIGGIVGHNLGKIMGFENNSSITNGKNVGGIVGYNTGGEIYLCTNNGNFSTSQLTYNTTDTDAGEDNILSENSGIGGICGFNNKGSIRACLNSGTIVGNVNVGGIAGINFEGIIEQCANKGQLTTTAQNRLGGITGVMSNGTVQHCYNTGNINGIVFGYNALYLSPTGGIVGIIYRNSNNVKYCYSTGNITGGAVVAIRYYMGGIIGYSVSSDNDAGQNNYYLNGTVNGGNGGWNATDKNGTYGRNSDILTQVLRNWVYDPTLITIEGNSIFINKNGYNGVGALWFEGEATPFTSMSYYNDTEQTVEGNIYLDEGYYEITLVAGGGGGYISYGGGSGSAYKGTVYLQAGYYHYKVGGYRRRRSYSKWKRWRNVRIL